MKQKSIELKEEIEKSISVAKTFNTSISTDRTIRQSDQGFVVNNIIKDFGCNMHWGKYHWKGEGLCGGMEKKMRWTSVKLKYSRAMSKV